MSSSILFPTNQYTTEQKSPEQIQNLMLPNYNNLKSSLLHIINIQHPLQLPYLYDNFKILFEYPKQKSICNNHKEDDKEDKLQKTQKIILDYILNKVVNQTVENQKIISYSLLSIIKLPKQINKFSSEDTEKILNISIECVNNLNSIANQLFLQIIKFIMHLQPTKTINKLQSSILQLGKITQPTISKVTAGRLILALSQSANYRIRGEMIDILKRILSDTQIEAKRVFINQIFPGLLENVQLDFIQLHLQQKIYETIYDQSEQISLQTILVIFQNLHKFSFQQQSTRIVKLFIDSLTNKNQKIAIMTTSIMGVIFQKLQFIILKSEQLSIKFWKSFIEIANNKNTQIINNFIYNLPGILILSHNYHRIDPVCDVYIQLLYQQHTNKLLLCSYLHQIVELFPLKRGQLRDTVFQIMAELFQEETNEESLKIVHSFMKNLHKITPLFLKKKQDVVLIHSSLSSKNLVPPYTSCKPITNHLLPRTNLLNPLKQQPLLTNVQYLSPQSCDIILRYYNVLFLHKNSNYFNTFYNQLKKIIAYISCQFIQNQLLARLYLAIKQKSVYLQMLVQILTIILLKDLTNTHLINTYITKFTIEFSKSTKAHEREATILFIYYASIHLPIQSFQEFKLGDKFLFFNNDKSFKNKSKFIQFLPRIAYFLTKQQKMEYNIILNKLRKDTDEEIALIVEKTDFKINEITKEQIIEESNKLKQKQKNIAHFKKLQMVARRESKQLKKQDIVRKINTKSKTKVVIKQMDKKKIAKPTFTNRKNS